MPSAATSLVCAPSIAHKPKPALRSRPRADAVASTASHPNVRDDGQRPSYRDGMARSPKDDLPDEPSEKYLLRGLDDPISLNKLMKFVFACTRNLRAGGRLRAARRGKNELNCPDVGQITGGLHRAFNLRRNARNAVR